MKGSRAKLQGQDREQTEKYVSREGKQIPPSSTITLLWTLPTSEQS